MKSSVLAVAAVLATSVVAQPHGHQHQKHHIKRDIVTEFESTTTTIDVTTTIWVNEGESVPTAAVETPSSAAAATSQVAAQFFEPPAAPSSTLSTLTTTAVAVASVPAVTEVATQPPTTLSSVISSAPAPVAPAAQVAPAPAPVPEPATTSVAPVVVPTTSAAPVAVPTTAAAAPVVDTSSSSSGALAGERGGSVVSDGTCSSGSPCHGKATYYETDGTGSCGENVDGTTVPIVALPQDFMNAKGGANPNNNPYCNKGVTLSYNGKTVNAYVFDKCPGCADKAIDLSHAAFQALDSNYLIDGTIQVDWWFN